MIGGIENQVGKLVDLQLHDVEGRIEERRVFEQREPDRCDFSLDLEQPQVGGRDGHGLSLANSPGGGKILFGIFFVRACDGLLHGQPMPVRSFAGGSHHLLEYLCTAAQPPHVGLREEARRFLVEVLRLVEPSLREPQPRLGIAGVEGGVISTWIRPRNTGQHQCQHDCTA